MDNEEEKRFMRMTKAELVDHIQKQEYEIRELNSITHLPGEFAAIGLLVVAFAVMAIPFWLLT